MICNRERTAAAANTWDYSMDMPEAAAPVTGQLVFGPDGNLTSPAADAEPVIDVQGMPNQADDMSLTWNLYNGSTPRLTQFAQPTSVSANAQDGSAASAHGLPRNISSM